MSSADSSWSHVFLVISAGLLLQTLVLLWCIEYPLLLLYSSHHPPSLAKPPSTYFLSVFVFNLIMFYVSYFSAMLTDPGAIPVDQIWINGKGLTRSSEDEEKFQTLLLFNKDPLRLFMSPRREVKGYLNSYLLSPSHQDKDNPNNPDQNRTEASVINVNNPNNPTGLTPLTHKEKEKNYIYNWFSFLKQFPTVQRKHPKVDQSIWKGGGLRYCCKCERYKPDRTHHCRRCNRCVLRMDHHCVWLNNCIGYVNYKPFLLTLLYGACAVLQIFVVLVPLYYPTLKIMLRFLYYSCFDDPNTENHTYATVGSERLRYGNVMFTLCMLLGMLVGAISGLACVVYGGYHVKLVTDGMSQIEDRESHNSKHPYITHRFAIGHAKFDQGPWRNLSHFLGPWYLWLVPHHPGAKDINMGTYISVPMTPVEPCTPLS